MTQPTTNYIPMVAERLARYYAEAVAKNPKWTIHECMEFAVNSVPKVKAAPKLFEALEAVENGMMQTQGFIPFFMENALKEARGQS